MDIVLNRKGGVPLHDQLLAQLELRILGGSLAPGERLPSVRALARQLGLHANTVSAAYRELETAGHVQLKRGAGVFVRVGAPSTLEEARGLDEMARRIADGPMAGVKLWVALRCNHPNVGSRPASTSSPP